MNCGLDTLRPELAALLNDCIDQILVHIESSRQETHEEHKSDTTLESRTDLPPLIYRNQESLFGWQISHPSKDQTVSDDTREVEPQRRKVSPIVVNTLAPSRNSLLGWTGLKSIHFDFAFQERGFCRKLHRFCLEQTYRWFIDPNSPPDFISRVFGLLPCLRDREKVLTLYQHLIKSGIGEPLEILAVPFYSIGGAGTHYPQRDTEGNPIHPENMQMLNKLPNHFFIQSHIERGYEVKHANSKSILDGANDPWFDCHDIQGYLMEKGIDIENPSLFVDIPEKVYRSILNPSEPCRDKLADPNSLELRSPDCSLAHSIENHQVATNKGSLYAEQEGRVESNPSNKTANPAPLNDLENIILDQTYPYILDVELFFNCEFLLSHSLIISSHTRSSYFRSWCLGKLTYNSTSPSGYLTWLCPRISKS